MSSYPRTRNFTVEELLYSSTASKNNINNIPTEEVYIDNLVYLMNKCLQPARDYFNIPMIINSGYRSSKLNKLVGGSPTSFHSIGCAADVDFGNIKTPTLKELFIFFHNSVPFTELIAEELPEGWIHIALQKGRENEKQVKYKLKGQPVKRATFEEVMKII